MSVDANKKSNFIFLGGVPHPTEINKIHSKSLGLPQIAAEKFQENFYERLKKIPFCNLNFISLPYTGSLFLGTKSLCYKPVIEKENGIYYGKFITLPGIYSITRESASYNILKREIENSKLNKHFIFIYAAHLPFIKAAIRVKRNSSKIINLILIVPDLPKYSSARSGFLGSTIELIKSYYFRNFNKILSDIDGFIIFSEEIKSILDIKRPSFTLYGLPSFNWSEENLKTSQLANNQKIQEKAQKDHELVLLYSGGISFRYGIKDLIDSIGIVNAKGVLVQLILCGSGDAVEYVRNTEKHCSSVNYLGILPHEEVIELQKNVDMFVNPRKSNDVFVKYSFPSKMLEYCKQMKPVIGYQLPTYPSSLLKAMIVPKEETAEALAEAIIYAARTSSEERRILGENGLNFLNEFASEDYFNNGITNLLDRIISEKRQNV